MEPPAPKPRIPAPVPAKPVAATHPAPPRAPPQTFARPAAPAVGPAGTPPPPQPEEKPAAKATPRAGKLASTGISGLDAQLGGGIPRGTTLLLISEPGNAIPLFSEQFSGGGLDAGEDVVYFQFDRPCGGLRPSIEAFVLRGNEGKAMLTIHDGYSPQFGVGGNARTRDPKSIPVAHNTAIEAMVSSVSSLPGGRPYRLVVESLSSITREDNEREVLKFVRNLVYLGHEMDGLHVISMVKGMHSPGFEAQLRHLAGGVFEFGAERKGFGIYNYLVVSKLLNVQDPVRILLWKETDKGLWLESTKRVF